MPWGRLHLVGVLTWVAFVSLALARLVLHRVGRRTSARVAAWQLLVLAPAIVALGMAYVAFGSGHGHPTAQLGDRALWSLWVKSWLPLLASCFIAGWVALARAAGVWRASRTSLSFSSFGWAGIAGADWMSVAFVFANWPDA